MSPALGRIDAQGAGDKLLMTRNRFAMGLVAGLLALAGVAHGQGAPAVVINEFLASNGNGLADEDGDRPDWIELRNRTGSPVALGGWALTDDAQNLKKWVFPAVTIPANGFLVVFASGKNRPGAARPHTNFSLNADGEYLALLDGDGQVMTEFSPAFPKQERDVSYGYDAAVANLFYFTTPTPGLNNSGGFQGFVADTRFSQNRGFFEEPFSVEITTTTPGATIRYTTDGTAPTATTGVVYTGPLNISGTTVLRAAAFRTGWQPSNVDTQTYLFLDDVIKQSPTGAPPPGWPSSWGSNSRDYGMDPDIVNSAAYRNTIKQDLKTLPSFSVVMRLGDMFDSSTGIYANPGQDGRAWERPCSLELIHPDGKEGFQINSGIRIRGGFSRSTSNPKHALRFFFRSEYGASKLRHPLFGDKGVAEFDNIDLRTFQNYSWSFQGDANGTFMRDQVNRDAQLAMGHQGERGDYYHLYINGQYWGIYNTCERPEASYATYYYGGETADYDVIKVEAGPYTINATDGNMTAWNTLYSLARTGFASNENYFKVLGQNPDGTPNPAYPVYIDPVNLIDYMLVIFYGGNLDAPISNFLGNQSPNNFYGLRNRRPEARQGFQFFVHDAEHTFLPWDLNQNRTGPYPAGDSSVTKSSPQWFWQRLVANAEFKMLAADRIHRHFFNGGTLTTQGVLALFTKRRAELDRAVVGESARWGDAKRAVPYTRETWLNAVNAVQNNYIPQRSAIVLNQLRAKGFYPNVAAPSFNQHGGSVAPGFRLGMSAPAGVVYYTMDGTDPRVLGGGVSAAARVYSAPVALVESVVVKSRALNGTTWSALNEAEFTLARSYKELLVTELMYNPAPLEELDGQELEFIELKNVGTETLDLSGVRFTNGVLFTYPNGKTLAPGEFSVLAKNAAAFGRRYPGVVVDGVYTNQLANGGERLTLVHAAGEPIMDFVYGDKSPWPTTPDGTGFSLVLREQRVDQDFSNASSWRASAAVGGSPGRDDAPTEIPVVVINEVLTHADPAPAVDAVELHNPGGAPVAIGGWWLSDSRANPKKFQIPAGTTIPAGGYVVFTEADFNRTPGSATSFSFSSKGEEAHLFSGDGAGNLTGYTDGFSFPAAANGVTFGRWTNSAGVVLFPPMAKATLGGPNSAPKVGPVVINEIHYAPTGGDVEFVEIKNISASPVRLFDPAHPGNTWDINGIGFQFPGGVTLAAGGIAVVTAGDPAVLRAKYGIPAAAQVFGPYGGSLQDNGEQLELRRPDTPEPDGSGGTSTPMVVVDTVRYSNKTPWPLAAAGGGSSLEKLVSGAFGNDPSAWRASPGRPSAGLNNDGNRPPIVEAGADLAMTASQFPVNQDLAASATDDGFPKPPGMVSYTWSQVSGPGVVAFLNPGSLRTTAAFPGVGVYVVQMAANDGELETTDQLTVTISRPTQEATFVPEGAVWKYLDTGTDLGVAWQAPEFNDAAWKSGNAQLGYGDGDEATVVSFGPNSASKYTTTYFRHHFTIPPGTSVSSAQVGLLRDDGAVVYLNGVEVMRDNMPEGAIQFQTFASAVVGGAEENTFYYRDIDVGLLRQGANTLAVEVHQVNAESSDLSFDLALRGRVSEVNRPPVVSAGPDVTVDFPNPAMLAGTVSDDGLPTPPGVFTASWSIESGPGMVEFANANLAATTATFSRPGVYTLRLTGADGATTTRDTVVVTVRGELGYEGWASREFSAAELANPAISGPEADPDGDGFPNLSEFLAGTRPKDPLSRLEISWIQVGGEEARLRFPAMEGKSYTIQFSNTLEGGAWMSLLSMSPREGTELLEILDPTIPGQPTRYYRVVTPEQREP